MTERKWITTTGGPLVILSKSDAKNWNGCFSQKLNEEREVVYVFEDDFMNPDVTDYGKACQIEDELNAFDFGKEKAIILSGESSDSTYLKVSEYEFLIIRWNYADSIDVVNFYLQSDEIKNISNWIKNEKMEFLETDHIIFDSSQIGSEIYKNESIEFSIEPGVYQIMTADFKPDKYTFLLLHKFEKID